MVGRFRVPEILKTMRNTKFNGSGGGGGGVFFGGGGGGGGGGACLFAVCGLLIEATVWQQLLG